MSKQSRPLPPYPPEAVVDSGEPSQSKPVSTSPRTLIPCQYATFVRVLVDIEASAQYPSETSNESPLPALKAGDVIRVTSREEENYWTGRKGDIIERFKLDDRFVSII
jgi:hypothetical protein